MSQENVELVRRVFEAFAQGGLDAIGDFLADDIDHRAVEGAIDDRGPIHGKDALRAYLQEWLDMLDDPKLEPVELIDAGEDQVIAVMRGSGRPKGTSAEGELTLSYANVYTIRDGKIARGREYWTKEEALKAAGLSEYASQENVEMVRGLWEPFKGVDLTGIDWDGDAFREMTERFWSPEVELRWTRNSPEARVYQGREGLIQAFREWMEPFSEYYNEPLDFIEVGDRVVVPNRQSGIGSASGIPVEFEFTWVYEIRDGQLARIDEYDTLEEALEAAGLSE
jgi:ketosteroid isomerase-like protein